MRATEWRLHNRLRRVWDEAHSAEWQWHASLMRAQPGRGSLSCAALALAGAWHMAPSLCLVPSQTSLTFHLHGKRRGARRVRRLLRRVPVEHLRIGLAWLHGQLKGGRP